MSRLFALALLCIVGCADTGRAFVTVEFHARGTDAPTTTIDGWDVTLTRADVSIGPIYFCATQLASSEFCEDALLEQRETWVVNGIDADVQPFGMLRGVTGTVRSTTYDFGWSYFLTEAASAPTEGAVEGHSAVLEGTAVRGTDTVPFRFDVDVIQQIVGGTAIHGARTMHDVDGPGDTVTVTVDPLTWLGAVDFDALFAQQSAPGALVHIARGKPEHDAIVFGMTSQAPPTFAWSAGGD